GPRSDQRGVALVQLEHFADFVSGGDLQLGNADEMAASLHHDSFQFGVGKRSAEHGHGPFAVDYRSQTELFIWIARVAESAFYGAIGVARRCKQFLRSG